MACNADCRPSPETLARLDQTPALAESLAMMGGRASTLLERRLLAPEDVDRWLADMAARGHRLEAAVSPGGRRPARTALRLQGAGQA